VRRELSFSLRTITPIKFNHDVVVPKGRIPQLFGLVNRLKRDYRLRIPSFGHAGDGNIHSTFLFSPDDPDEERRADAACHDLFELAIRLGGTVTGEHGIGWLKRGQLPRQLGDAGYDLHLRIKNAFDPKGLLNPGKKR